MEACPQCKTHLTHTSAYAFFGRKEHDDVLYCEKCGAHGRTHGNTDILKTIVASKKLFTKQCDTEQELLAMLAQYNIGEDGLRYHISRTFTSRKQLTVYQLNERQLDQLIRTIKTVAKEEKHAVKNLVNYHNYIRKILKMKNIHLQKVDASPAYYNPSERAQFIYDLYEITTVEQLENLLKLYKEKEDEILCSRQR